MEQDEGVVNEFPKSSWTIAGFLLSLAGTLACTMAYSASGLSFGTHGKTGCSILLVIACITCTREFGRAAVVGSSLAVGSFYGFGTLMFALNSFLVCNWVYCSYRRRGNGEARRYSDTYVDMSDFEVKCNPPLLPYYPII